MKKLLKNKKKEMITICEDIIMQLSYIKCYWQYLAHGSVD